MGGPSGDAGGSQPGGAPSGDLLDTGIDLLGGSTGAQDQSNIATVQNTGDLLGGPMMGAGDPGAASNDLLGGGAPGSGMG